MKHVAEQKKHGSMQTVADLITEAENVAAHLDGEVPAIAPQGASMLLQSILSALRTELGIAAPFDDEACDCQSAAMQGGAVGILDLLAGGAESLPHPMDCSGREVAA